MSVDCNRNQLASLNVTGCTALEYLVCGSNDIKSLDVTRNTALTHLECYSCRLEELDVSQNTELEYLDCGGIWYNPASTYNTLTSLDLANNTKLKTLICDRNKLTALDLSSLPLLERLECYSNDITALDLRLGASGIMSEIPKLTVRYSPGSMPYHTDMKDYTGDSFTSITSLTACTSDGGEILTSFMTDGTASFEKLPVKVVYTYDTGYTGSADISADIKIALVPDPDNFFSPLTVSVDVVSREVVVSPEIRYVYIVSPDPSHDVRGTGGSSGGCNALSGAFILAGVLGLTGLAVSRKH